jgi:hypothetical protein
MDVVGAQQMVGHFCPGDMFLFNKKPVFVLAADRPEKLKQRCLIMLDGRFMWRTYELVSDKMSAIKFCFRDGEVVKKRFGSN